MGKRTKLISRLSKRLELDYVGSSRVRSYREVILVQIVEYETINQEYRVSLMCREVLDEGEEAPKAKRSLKDFLSSRILGIVDLDTGEIVKDISKYLKDIIDENNGVHPRFWPRPEDSPFRTTSISVRFGDDNYAVGWKFGVHRAFMTALDISYVGNVLTEGMPPKYGFAVGDMFHYPAKPWGKDTLLSIQVQDVNDEILQISIFPSKDKSAISQRGHEITQNRLIGILKDGMSADDFTEFGVVPLSVMA
jgi:hypothetical protein